MRLVAIVTLLLTLIGCAGERMPDPRSPALFAAFASHDDYSTDRRQFDKRMRQLLHARRYTEAEQALLLLIDGAPKSELKAAVLATPVNGVELHGLAEVLHALTPDYAEKEERWYRERFGNSLVSGARSNRRTSGRTPLVTAIGVDVSGHAIDNTSDHSKLYLETFLYSDGVRKGDIPAFSRLNRAQLVRALEADPSRMNGEFDNVSGSSPSVSGLSELTKAYRGTRVFGQGPRPLPDRALRALAEWWVIVAVDAALARDVPELQPDRRAPIILGTHDFGSTLRTVHIAGE